MLHLTKNSGFNELTTTTIVNNQNRNAPIVNYPLILVIVGTLLNSFSFYILCRRRFQDTNNRPIIHYMRTTALFDIIMLYGWNLDHFLRYAYNFTLLRYSLPTCKIFTFLNYFAPQVSAWFRVFICLDRYLSMSRLRKTYFSHSRNALITIGCIIVVFLLINTHLLIFACFYKADRTIDLNGRFYAIYPLWDYVNLALFNFSPFLLMVIFNSGIISHLIQLRQTTTVQVSRIRHRSISICLVVTTFLFLVMTTPATIGFAFFSRKAPAHLLHFFDSVMYTHHILSFPLYMITFLEFRREVLILLRIRKQNTVSPRR